MADEEKLSRDEALFLQLVSMFQIAALQQMGKIPSPVSGEIELDMEQAKMSVDILSMLKEKTQGNLSSAEEEFLGKVVFESQMNYLEELKKPKEEKTASNQDGAEGEARAREGKAPEETDGETRTEERGDS